MNELLIRELFEYHQKANQLYVEKLYPRQENIPEYAYKMFSHNVLAQHVWHCRILQKAFLWKFDHIFQEEELHVIFEQNQKDLNTILESKPLDALIAYTNMHGEKFQSQLGDILLHVSHHFSYHRGQMAYTLRQAGIDPPPTDLIIWRRS